MPNDGGIVNSVKAVRPFIKPEPLTEAELDRLGEFLDCCEGGKAMNVEELDGFFAALIAGPEVVMPSEYNRECSEAITPASSPISKKPEKS
jgi:Uncharacterised protein family (UPF0149)